MVEEGDRRRKMGVRWNQGWNTTKMARQLGL